MKILFLSNGWGQDYLRDSVAHGMRSLLGPDFIDVHKLDCLYQGADRSQMYGKGFTLYGLLPDIPIDRTDIPRKISCKYFDLVIYGSIHRNQDYLHEVASMYQAPQVIFIDGEDHTNYLKGLQGITFKRELHSPQPGALPIQFAIPQDRILRSPPQKFHLMAPMDPMNKSTYIYTTEEAYYKQYADSYYAATMRKGGADCLRHYEIMSQWTIPYFRCLESIPTTIMQFLPRPELLLAKEMIDYMNLNPSKRDPKILIDLWGYLIEPVMKALRDHLTTTAMATYIFDSIGISSHKEVALCS